MFVYNIRYYKQTIQHKVSNIKVNNGDISEQEIELVRSFIGPVPASREVAFFAKHERHAHGGWCRLWKIKLLSLTYHSAGPSRARTHPFSSFVSWMSTVAPSFRPPSASHRSLPTPCRCCVFRWKPCRNKLCRVSDADHSSTVMRCRTMIFSSLYIIWAKYTGHVSVKWNFLACTHDISWSRYC